MVDSNREIEDRIRQLFDAGDEALPGPSPFLETRILARLTENEHRARLRRWKRWAILSPLVAAALALAVFVYLPAEFQAPVNTSIVIRVEVEELRGSAVAYAEVELPDDVTFYSEKYPELTEEREIRLAWLGRYEEDSLPIVVRASTPGLKRVKLRFLDQNETVLEERELEIDFRAPLKHGGFFVS
jgi:hypothetical protein